MELYMRTVVCISLFGNGKTGVMSTALYGHPLMRAPHVLLWILFFVPGERPYHFSQFDPLNNADNGHFFPALPTLHCQLCSVIDLSFLKVKEVKS